MYRYHSPSGVLYLSVIPVNSFLHRFIVEHKVPFCFLQENAVDPCPRSTQEAVPEVPQVSQEPEAMMDAPPMDLPPAGQEQEVNAI